MMKMRLTMTGESTIMYRFGDVVLLPFLYTDLRAVKTRPAVIVNGARYQASYPDLVV